MADRLRTLDGAPGLPPQHFYRVKEDSDGDARMEIRRARSGWRSALVAAAFTRKPLRDLDADDLARLAAAAVRNMHKRERANSLRGDYRGGGRGVA